MPIRSARLHYGAAWSTSEKVAALSDGAGLLWRILTDEAGDDGEVPVTSPLLRAITASRPWSQTDLQSFLSELEKVGALTREMCSNKPFLVLYRYSEFNFPPTGGKGANIPRHYPGWECRIDHAAERERRTRYGEGTVKAPSLHSEGTETSPVLHPEGTVKHVFGNLPAPTKTIYPTPEILRPSVPLPNQTTNPAKPYLREKNGEGTVKSQGRHGEGTVKEVPVPVIVNVVEGGTGGADAPSPHTKKTMALEPPTSTRRQHEPINDEFLAEVRARFPMLDIDAELARAQNRRQWDDYKDKRRHFEDWLERSRDHIVPPAVAARNGSRPASAAPIPTIWMPSMGAEHRGEGSSIKVCSRAECQDRVCLALRRKVGVAGESGKPAFVQERAVAPS